MKKIFLKIAGGFIYKDKLLPFILKNKWNKKFYLSIYDGVNNCKWNGGRVNYENNIKLEDIEKYNKLGISVDFVFTNWIIDLNDSIGLQLLDWLNYSQKKYNLQNQITLNNEKFRKFLRENYNFKLIASITQTPSWLTLNADPQKVLKFYKKLEKRFDYIVPNRIFILEEWFLKNLDLKKYLILFNYACQYDCPFIKKHFLNISKQNSLKTYNYNVEKCFIKNQKLKINHDFSRNYFLKLLKFYKNFKFAGRNTSFYELKNDLEILKGLK